MINVYAPNANNFENNGLATLTPISCDYKIGLNGSWQITMEHPFDKELRYQHLVKDAILRITDLECVNEFESNTQFFRIFDTSETLTSVTVIAFPVALEAVYDAPIETLTIQNKTGVQAGQSLDGVSEKYTVSSDVTKTESAKYENTNLIASISGSDDDSFVNKWGGEVVYDNYKIKIKNKMGDQSNASSYPIRYGRNLTGLTHETDMSSVITRLFPISSDDLRLNGWQDVTSQGGYSYVDSARISDYPFIRSMFVEVAFALLDTDSNSISETATATANWQSGIISAVTTQATSLWNTAKNDLSNTYCAEYLQELISGEDGIVGYLQRKYVYTHKGWQSFVKSCAKQGVEWVKSAEIPEWEWHEDTSVIPHAWWYGDASVSPAVSYAKNEYVKIGKKYEWFGDDGYWRDYMGASDMQWYQSQSTGKWWYGDRERYYAHNEFVYMTVDGVMQEWWYDEDGWYDADSSGESDYAWHGDSSSGYWFGEEGASADDKSKYIHDKWAFIDGTYYWFDSYGYISGDAETTRIDYQWGDQTDEVTGKSWFGNTDKNYGAIYLKSQWMKIDNEWYYFDSEGYMVDMDSKKSETIAWFANSVYNNTIDYVTTCLTSAYTLLYNLMIGWCNKQYDNGLDLPTVNVSVDLIDLSKTSEYADFENLEKIKLGDKVLVVGRAGNQYEERVVGLTYDCLRKYNKAVEVGQLSKTVSQIVSVTYSGASEGQKLIAGDGVTIDGKVIQVGDYVGRTVGLSDVLLNGSSVVSGNIADFGIQAGDNVTISRSGNVLTINAEGGALEYWNEDKNKISRKVSSTVSTWDCDSEYNHGQFQIKNGVNNWIIKKNTNTACCAYYSFNGFTYPMIISTVEADAVTSQAFIGDGVRSFTKNGVTLYYSHIGNNSCWNPCDILYDAPPNLGDFTDYYTEHGNDATATQEYVRDLLMELSNFHTSKVEYSGIGGNNSNYVAWGGTKYGVGNIDAQPQDVPFNVTKQGAVSGKSFIEDGVNINTKYATKTELATKQDKLVAGSNIQIAQDGKTISATDTTYSDFAGSTHGLVPAVTTQAGKFLKDDGTWAEASGASAVEDLTDVDLNNLSNGQVLKYNSTSLKWENANESGGGGNTYIVDAMRYSTDEQVVGVWTDGKPLYQKTVQYPSFSGQTYSLSLNISNVDKIFFISSGSYESTEIPLPFVAGNNSINNIGGFFTIGVNDTTFDFRVGSGMAGYMNGGYITVRYTKTTDTAGSGGYQAYGFSPVIYSTTEREVGVNYTNKPLYQKLFQFTQDIDLNANSWTATEFDASNIDTIMECYVVNATPARVIVSAGIINNEIAINSPRTVKVEPSKVDSYLFVQYTKTTDVAGSGNYNTLGVPTVHYSTNEQVIGTWINGKTLYQKSIEIQSVPSNSWDTFSYGISEAITVRDYKCMIFNGNVCMSCDHNRPDTVNSEFYCVADKAGFFIRTFNNNYSGSSAVVTIYYTKDND